MRDAVVVPSGVRLPSAFGADALMIDTVEFDAQTRWLLTHQYGLLSRSQVRAAGLSPEQLRRAARRWCTVLPGVWLVTDRPGASVPSRVQREMAGLLYAGSGSMLFGLTAARRLGVQSADPGDIVHVVVPATRRGRDLGWLSITRSAIPDAGVSRGPLCISRPARAVLDAAVRSRSAQTAAAIGIEAMQRRLVTVDELVAAMAQRNRRDSALARHALSAASTGAWSRPEAALLHAVARSRVLPPAWPNPRLSQAGRALLSPDIWFDDVALAVMVHSRRYHSGDPLDRGGRGRPDDWDTTVERDGELTAAGVVVVGVTPARIYRDIASVLARVEQTYLTASKRPRPAVVAHRRSVLRAQA